MINETRERFLKAILEQIPLERVVEVHLFPAIRQGQMETGVAVIAVTPLWSADAPAPELDLADIEPPAERAEVHTATYVWTRKGPDRGKWVVDVIAQADAPLATVETVVRGVQVRSGEALDAHRVTAAELHEMFAHDPMFAPVAAAPAVSADVRSAPDSASDAAPDAEPVAEPVAEGSPA